MCHYQQTSPDSHFTQNAVCSLATASGRITLLDNRLIVTTEGRREEREVSSESEYRALLQAHFGIDLPEEERVDRLMVPRFLSGSAGAEDG